MGKKRVNGITLPLNVRKVSENNVFDRFLVDLGSR